MQTFGLKPFTVLIYRINRLKSFARAACMEVENGGRIKK
jgi:hypothetical protein